MAVENSARLIATLEARVSKFERDLAKANGTARREFGAIEKRGQQMANRLETSISSAASRAKSEFAGLGKSLIAGFAGGFVAGGLQGFVGEMRNAVRSMSEMSAEAKRAGVGVVAFQELGYAARQNGVSIDALTDGLKELQLRADEFIVTGKGSGAEAFQRLGYGADELKAKLADPSRLFIDIIGRIAALRDTAAGIRIADEIFGGTGGEQFVRFLEEGEAGIRRNIDEARKLGLVIDEDVVRKGVELDKQFQKIADTIGTNIKNAVVGVATAMAEWSTGAEKFLNSLGNSRFFKALSSIMGSELEADYYGARRIEPGAGAPAGAIDPKGLEMLRRAMGAAGDRAAVNAPDRAKWLPTTFVDPKLAGMRADFQASLAGFIQAARDAGHDVSIQSGVRSTERQAELFAAAVRKYGSEAEARKWVAPPGRSFHEKGSAADLNYAGAGMKGDTAAARSAREWAHANASRFGLGFPLGNEAWHIEPADQRGKPRDGDPDTSGLEAAAQDKAAAARKKVADAAAQQAEKVRRVMEALGLEADQVGKTAQQQEVLQRLQQAGVDLNSKEGQAIAAKVAQLYALQKAQEDTAASAERLKQAREAWADAGAEATKSIVADLRDGKSLADAFASALDRLTQKLLDQAIDQAFAGLFGAGGASSGGGLLGGLGAGIASLFGGARANGGPLRAGKWHLVGEEGPELVRGSGAVVPHAASMAMLAEPRALPETPKGIGRAPIVNVPRPEPAAVTIVEGPLGFKAEKREERDENGRRRERVVFKEVVSGALSERGAASDAQENRYGFRARVPRR